MTPLAFPHRSKRAACDSRRRRSIPLESQRRFPAGPPQGASARRMVVPARASTALPRDAMMALRPGLLATNFTAASILGSMEPGVKRPSARYALASAGLMTSISFFFLRAFSRCYCRGSRLPAACCSIYGIILCGGQLGYANPAERLRLWQPELPKPQIHFYAGLYAWAGPALVLFAG